MKKPILYVQCRSNERHNLAFDFCYSAKMGAEQLDIKVKAFEDSCEVPRDPTNILVGSVEQLTSWLNIHQYPIPTAIDLHLFSEFLGRQIAIMEMDTYLDMALELYEADQSLYIPQFIKPSSEIKAFTGFVDSDPTMVTLWSNNYTGSIIVQDVVDIVSEYRVYITNNKFVGMKHYQGDYFKYPDPNIIHNCKKIGDTLNYHSYVLDFGVLSDGSTILIEPNDAWAIGNYGLEPEKYYLMIRNRWLQLTGIRKSM